MEFTIWIPQSIALQNCSTEFNNVKISADKFERVLTELKPEERKLLHVDSSNNINMIMPNNHFKKIESDSSEVEDIVQGIRKLFKNQLNERMEKIQESQKILDHIEADPEHYISKLRLTPKWEAHPERLRQRCKAAHNDNLAHYMDIIEKTLETARAHWWDYIRNPIINQMASPGRGYIQVNDERINWTEILKLSEEHNLAVEPLKEMDNLFKQFKRDEELEKEEEAEKIKESKQAWIAWCMEHGSADLKWAIENDYPIGTQYQAEVINYLLPEETDNYTLHHTVHEDHGLRKVPNKASREAHKALSDRVEHISLLPPNTSVKVGQIHSVELYVDCECRGEEYCDKCDDDLEVLVKRTAIPVTVKALHVEHTVWYVIEED